MKYLKNVSTLKYDPKKCINCERCLNVCPHAVFSPSNTDEKRIRLVNKDACMECGGCAKNCPTNALVVRPGVGCAYAIIYSKITKKEISCGCD